MPRQRTRLIDKDFKLLKKEGMEILGETGQLFPSFGNHIEDYIKFDVYDLADTYIKSGISEDFENDGGNINLKPGNDLRKVGFTRGDYKVKYFFYRRLAGADEVVLTKTVGDESGIVHSGDPKLTGVSMGDFYVDDGGNVFQGSGPPADGSEPGELDVKEYKFFIDEISADKKEVRLAPQSINLDKYKDEFYSLYNPIEVYRPLTGVQGDFSFGLFTNMLSGLTFNNGQAIFPEPYKSEFQFKTKANDDPGFNQRMMNGTLQVERAFITGYKTEPETSENPNWILEQPLPELVLRLVTPPTDEVPAAVFRVEQPDGAPAPSGTGFSYYWDFDDGNTEMSGPVTSHVFDDGGSGNVTAVVNTPNFVKVLELGDELQVADQVSALEDAIAEQQQAMTDALTDIPIPLSSELDGKIIGWNGNGTAPGKNMDRSSPGVVLATKGSNYTAEWNIYSEATEGDIDSGIGAPHMNNDTLWYIQSGHRRWIETDRDIRTLKLLKPGASLFVADVVGDGNYDPGHDELRVSSYVIMKLPIGPDITEDTFTGVGDSPSTLALDEPLYEGGVTGSEGTSLTEHTIAVQAGTGGTVSGQGGATTGGYYQWGTTVSLHSNANSGYFFTTWTDSSGQNEFTNITNNSTQLVVKADATITAVFSEELPPEYNITVTTGGSGTVVSNPTSSPFTEGTTIEITALPYDGYQFSHWTDSSGQNTIAVNDSDTSFSAQASGTITAHFIVYEVPQYTLTVNTGVGGIAGIGSANGPSTADYDEGTVKTVVAQPNANYNFAGWTGDETGTGTNRTVTMDGNKTVNAGFTWAPGCFVAGTHIQIPNGIKYIEDIKVGDIVKSFDVGTSSTVNSKVTETYVHSDRYYMIINGIIKTTSVHPFYTDGKWVEAGDLSIGDKILHVDGLEHTIDSIELSDEPVTVYNFEVDGTHNYFAEGYLVHNK